MRIGHGYDAHRLKAGRPCILCGVRIPCEFGPDGHSDADVPIHALIDALLGALALGDIGKLYPDTDERFKNADNMELLTQVVKDINSRGYKIKNADITIILQSPKLSPYISDMRTKTAAAVQTCVENISVKATTEEGMGFTGDGTGIRAHAVVLLEKTEA
ncbi:MAG: 2-C-methyl-D-erythritol 2,4-cyclodiphosphate synthase [Clostridiales bacterium]|jgi:2-C-methyl-D-erythritol 2,4-cyclodiphosphate synthase|nr:2-C-methyl-D-erythritol 2,4-cyclodiphosphate synthase [Clostridiales bacterium]